MAMRSIVHVWCCFTQHQTYLCSTTNMTREGACENKNPIKLTNALSKFWPRNVFIATNVRVFSPIVKVLKVTLALLQTQQYNLQQKRWEPQGHVLHTKDYRGRKQDYVASQSPCPSRACMRVAELPFQTTSKRLPFIPLIGHLSELNPRVEGGQGTK